MKLVSTELRSFLTGLLLGDGYIDKGIHKRAFRIKNTHEDFISYIYDTLKENTEFKVTINTYDSYTSDDNANHQKYWELVVSAHPYFAKRYHNFYNDNRKRHIPKETLKWLDPIGLANWYMSDGYVVRVGSSKGKVTDRRVELATDRYKEADVDRVVEYLNDKYDIKSKKIRRGNAYRIRISLPSAQKFFLLISDYVVDSYKYKLDLCYDYQPKWMCDEYFNLMKEISECRPPELMMNLSLEGDEIV